MMKKGLLCFILSVVLVFSFAGYTWSDDDALTIMHPDRETRLKWFQSYEDAPEAPVDPAVLATIPPRGSLSLISHLNYVPVERNQGSCGNCWAWAGTGCMEIDLDVQNGIFNRLSVQYINSCETSVIGKTCCAGGWLEDVADFYSATAIGHAIPWSNTNAHWQDGDAGCDVSCSSISTSPNYPINSITEQSITTTNVAQATAIANIKAQLASNKAVWFAFFLPNYDSWNGTNGFRTFWNNYGESTTWQIDQWCGQTYTASGGGHAVLCVGYNDDDPNNSYWIMVNSWGTASGGRPNGIFHMDMDMDYGCTFYDGGYYWSFYWQVLDIDWEAQACCTMPTQVAPYGQIATETPTYEWTCTGPWEWYWVYVINKSTGDYYGSDWVNSPANSWTQPYELPWGTYQWWVRVYDSDPDCLYSEWSGPMEFTVGHCCAKPTLDPVPDGVRPTFEWACDTAEWTYAYVYLLNNSTGAVYSSGWLNGGQQVDQWTPTSDLPWGNYQAWVIVYHPECGYSEWSDPQEFNAGHCCAMPSLNVDTSGADPVFSWSCGMNGAEWTYAYVYLLNNSTGAVYGSGWLNGGQQVSQWTATGLPWGIYQAWVIVWHPQCEYSEWSDPVNFTNGSCCAMPNLNVNVVDTTPQFSWACGSAQWEYAYVYLLNNSTGAVYGSGWLNGGQVSQWNGTGLPWGNYQAWVIVYHSQCGYSEWSDPVNFTLGSCCAKPTLSQVADGTTQPTFSWSCGGQWDWFEVWVYNETTGVGYDGGWINDPNATTYAWPFPLPWGHYWAYVIVWHPQCGYSEWSAPVDWTVGGTCCDQPTLQTPSGNQPTYQWSCGSASWTYFWVYVQNIATGAYYGTGTASYGWVNSPANSWASTSTLPPGNYRAWVAVYEENCGVSQWSINKDWTVTGDGVASTRFYNNLVCGGDPFTATFTICGDVLSASSGNWSICETATPATCSWTLYADTACGLIDWNGTYAVAGGYVYNFWLDLDEYDYPILYVYPELGDCTNPTPWSFDTTGSEVLMKFPLKGFQRAQ